MGRPPKNLRAPLLPDEAGEVVDIGPALESTRPGGYAIRLNTLDELRVELGRVYRDARQGRIDTQDATRLAYVLDRLRQMIETDVIAKRIEALEARVAVVQLPPQMSPAEFEETARRLAQEV